MKTIPKPKSGIPVLLAAVLLASPTAQAATKTWNNTGTDFNTTGFWTGGTPGASDNATFTGAMLTNPNLSASLSIQGLTFSSTTTSGYTLTASASQSLTLTNVGTGTTAAINAANTSGTNTISAPLILGGAAATQAAFTQAAGGTLAVSGNISSTNTEGILINGAGTVSLSGNNSYTGLTTVNAAGSRLVLSGDNNAATGGVTVTSGTLDIRNTKAIAGTLTGGTGALGTIVNGTGSAITLANVTSTATSAGFTLGATTNTGGNGDINFGTGNVSYGSSAGTILMLGTGATFRFDGVATNTLGTSSSYAVNGAGNTLIFGNTVVANGTGATNALTTFSGTGNITILGAVANGTNSSALGYSGLGTLTLGGNNTYTGSTNLNSGTVILDYSTNTGTKISGIGTGGTLTFAGSVALNLNAGSVTETVGQWNLNAGANSITRTGGSTGKIVAALLNRGFGGTLSLDTGGILSTTSGSANSLLTSIASGTATGGVVGVVGGNDWAAKGSGNDIVGLSTTTSTYTNSTSLTVSGNADIVTDVSGTALAATTLRFNGATARTIDVSGGTLTLNQGGILVTAAVGNNPTTITGGTLKSGTNNALIIFQNNTSSGLTIESTIADGAAASSLIKSGAGLMTLSNASNSYTGKTYLNQGTLNIVADASLGTAPGSVVADQLTMTGGTLQFGANNITLSANRGLNITGAGNTFDTNGFNATVAGIIVNGGAPGSLTKTGAGTLTLTATNSTFTGPFKISGGTVNVATLAGVNGASSIGNGGRINQAQDLVLDGGTLQYTGTAAASTVRHYTLTTNGGGFDASGTTLGTLAFSGNMTASGSSGTQTFTLTGTGSGATGGGTISGTINNGSGTNVTSLSKTGTGTWTLSGANTYTGNTTISGGTLTLSGSSLFAVANASSTQFLGTGTVNFNGSFKFDLSGVSISNGSWTLVDVTNLSETFSLTSVTSTTGMNFTNNSGIWTSTDSLWSFNQATGILTGGSAVPEPSTYAALFGTLVLGVAVTQRRRSKKSL